MSEFKRTALHDFVHMRGKSPPPIFVGRNDVITDILTIAKKTKTNRVGIPGNTTVIQGAPGAGKSAVLNVIEHRAPEVGARVVNISTSDLEKNLPKVLSMIAAVANYEMEYWNDLWARYGSKWLTNLWREMSNISFSYDSLDMLQQRIAPETWKAPVIIAIDEAQRFTTGKNSDHAYFLQNIHDARTVCLPLTLVLAGLGDTPDVIRNLGLTHGVAPYSLGCFTSAECAALTTGWCAHFGIDIGDQRARIDALMASTDGWPRHVHWAQRALAEALLQESVEGKANRLSDWDVVQTRSNALRRGYYQTQYSDVMVASRKLVGRVMLEVANADIKGKGLTFGQVVDAVEAYKESAPGSEWRVPPGKNDTTYVTELIHCGALQRRSMDPDDRTLICPIPSFQSYIIQQGGFQVPGEPSPDDIGNSRSFES
ncbi:MAG: hypothetical protein OXC62_06975 [Aestuariivita sp.]|nr:hypothetical protein [Aestuariivita sp.]